MKSDFNRQKNSFSKFFKRKGLEAPIWKLSVALMHQFCSKSFFVNTPILKKSFLWIHPFWRKVFSECTHLEKSFLWMHPFWVYLGDWNTVPPIPRTTTTRRRRTKLSSPWSVGFAADKNPAVYFGETGLQNHWIRGPKRDVAPFL